MVKRCLQNQNYGFDPILPVKCLIIFKKLFPEIFCLKVLLVSPKTKKQEIKRLIFEKTNIEHKLNIFYWSCSLVKNIPPNGKNVGSNPASPSIFK